MFARMMRRRPLLALLVSAALAWVDESGGRHPYYLRPSQFWFDKHNLTNPGPSVTFNLTGALEEAARTPCKVCNKTGSRSFACGDRCVASRAACNLPRSFGCAVMHPAKKCSCLPFEHFPVQHTRCSWQGSLYHLSSRIADVHEPNPIVIGATVDQQRESALLRLPLHGDGRSGRF